ncbi:MAG: DUF177 domain-containing protein [Propionibacteriaceae bacterium]|jgi:uncharacterized protein|nr:DUF177 domain-containing protein [Propionibacteriaceae bacterium]
MANPLVFSIHDLGGRSGQNLEIRRQAPAPEGFGLELIGIPVGSAIDLDVKFEGAGDGVWVTGDAQFQLVGSCSRCLIELDYDDETSFEEFFYFSAPEGEEEPALVTEEAIDITEVLRDQVLVDLPFQPLCKPDCLGLCPTCGVNLNENPDHHHDAETDPRWDMLKSWQESH